MDFQLTPSNLNLTTKLAQITSAGVTPTEDILDSQILWQYLIPSVDRNEFRYEGTTVDPTPPSFKRLLYSNSTTCHVRQLSGRSYTTPAFELEFLLSEPQGVPNISYRVGTYKEGRDVIDEIEMAGERLVIPHALLPAQEMHVTIVATNQNSESMVGSCSMPVYDRSPPLARIQPIKTHTSNPNEFVVLLTLFDEFGLEDMQQVAIGTVAGQQGTDIVDWQPVNTADINTPPTGGALDLYSFPRVSTISNIIIG